jgi:hypothetical protein
MPSRACRASRCVPIRPLQSGRRFAAAAGLLSALIGTPAALAGGTGQERLLLATSSQRPAAGPAGEPAVVTPAPAPVTRDLATLVDDLVAAARDRALWQHPDWLRLGHWRTSPWRSGWHSEADGPGFFLARRGEADPQAELEATLRGFFSPPRAHNQHPACRFPARLAWLQSQLDFGAERIPQTSCPEFGEYLALLQPRSATLVFSAYYLDNPASAFGHTLLRINKGTGVLHQGRRQLLDTGINYSAVVDTGNALLYAIKGLTGLFLGTFTRMPYYYKVREYNDFESRDLWEYDLELSNRELAMLVAHIWELGSTHFDYYYLTENCSYHILGALEAAAPRLRLLEHVKRIVIPADTIKALYANPGLVGAVRFRPSARTLFEARRRQLTSEQERQVERLAGDPGAPLPADFTVPARIAVLDAAADLIDLRHARQLLADPDGPASQHKQLLLARRARHLHPSPPVSLELPAERMPHAGHGSSRFGLGGGHSSGRGNFASYRFRLALHDLADRPRGYSDTFQLEFLATELRLWLERGEFSIDSIDLVHAMSLSPQGRFHRKPAWNLRVGGHRLHETSCRHCWVNHLTIGGGLAAALLDQSIAVFAMAESQLSFASGLAGIADTGLRFGAGPGAGLRLRLTDGLLAVASGSWYYLPGQAERTTWQTEGTLRYSSRGSHAIEARARHLPVSSEAMLSWLFYY